MRLHEITKFHARPKAGRAGRGISAGQGKTAGRGTKGQKSRTGANSNIPRTFEGGATGFIQRLPKLKGFKSHFVKPVTINLSKIQSYYEDGDVVTLLSLVEHGIVKPKEVLRGIKVVGSSVALSKKLTISTDDPNLVTSKALAA
jgi:large subunit ribosomal protein L15